MITGSDASGGDAVVAGAIEGDRSAMDALWREHRRWIAAVLLAHKCSEDHLDDLLQEVAMTLVAKIGTLRETGNARAWLRTVAVNTARASARARRARPRPGPLASEPESDGVDAGLPAALDEEARRILGMVMKLPEAYREPLTLRAVHGMRGRQIAAILGLSEATVETRIARARRMLREMNGGDGMGNSTMPMLAAKGDQDDVG